MLFSRMKTTLIEPDQALRGRERSVLVNPTFHDILGIPVQKVPEGSEVAYFALGCFWGAERLFWQTEGVWTTAVGYAGGVTPNPTYEETCSGRTGHTEAVLVVFDPEKIAREEILRLFWEGHDPTTENRQGNDVGTQYRSGIYTTRDGQREVAQDVIREIAASGTYRAPIVTEVVPLADYSTAEAYHQDYFLQHPNQGYCAFVVGPKVEKFQKTFAARVKG